jgi:hypothetical protein
MFPPNEELTGPQMHLKRPGLFNGHHAVEKWPVVGGNVDLVAVKLVLPRNQLFQLQSHALH